MGNYYLKLFLIISTLSGGKTDGSTVKEKQLAWLKIADAFNAANDKAVHQLQTAYEEELQGAILVVLANKQDMEGCMSVAEVHQALGLDQLKNRTFQIFKTSAVKGEGLDSAMDWLSNALQNKK